MAKAPTHHTDVLIIGSGPAGYTAAIYAARAERKPLLVAGMQPGGQLTITDEVENYPGFAKPVSGPWLMEQMREQAERSGTRMEQDIITHCALKDGPDKDGYFHLEGDSGAQYRARTVIIATGASARWLGLDSEAKFKGHGVSACATCDGFFFKNREVAVVGGGNTAVEEALYLTRHAAKVHLIHRREGLKAEKVLVDRLNKNDKIIPHWYREVEEIVGKAVVKGAPEVVTSVVLKDPRNPAHKEVLAVDGVFVAIGHQPNSGPFRDQLRCDRDGYIETKPGTPETSVAGVFAAGDVQDRSWRQAVTAAGTGCAAALAAERWLEERP
ncbi:thioredoxin-disulfide reductase [Formicincola oecophyllae]|uniref:Thioredoxin reductase n=1 Tax=Formicincola oecophyllae TaxID=2558361 RepID=A0A4Y6UE23_9PROT|nr:thioredoxin-disulfide reductase [Formicincola oecophyllae]QDH14265.1 thioredoxin-disulfide reductase [Formicincola oecophyllae]